MIDRLAGQHAKGYGHARRQRQLREPVGDRGCDIGVVRGFAADHAPEGDDGVQPATVYKRLANGGQLERARGGHHAEVGFDSLGIRKLLDGAGAQGRGDLGVVGADGNADAQSACRGAGL